MSLADELLADLEGEDNEDLEDGMEEEHEPLEEKPDVKDLLMEVDTTQINSVRELCKLRDSDKLKDIMMQIEEYGLKVRRAVDVVGPVEQDPSTS